MVCSKALSSAVKFLILPWPQNVYKTLGFCCLFNDLRVSQCMFVFFFPYGAIPVPSKQSTTLEIVMLIFCGSPCDAQQCAL